MFQKLHHIIRSYLAGMGFILFAGPEDEKGIGDESSMRDDLMSAFTDLSDNAGAPAPAPAPAAPAPAADPNAKSVEETPEAKLQRERNERGQFTKRPAAAPGTDPALAGTPAPAPGAVKAPGSWTPEARETFAALPPVAQQEIMRREREISNTLNQTAEARRFHEEVRQAIAPFEAILQSENATPVQAISSLFKTAAALRTGSPAYKAQLVAGMIRDFSIDPALLEQAYAAIIKNGGPVGQAPGEPAPDAALQQILNQQLAPIQQFIQQFQHTQTQSLESELEAFTKDPANEFVQDVAEEMADLLELSARRQHPMSLQEAYRRATLAHPTISQILENRRSAAGVAQQTAAARRAKQAAVSVSSQSAPLQNDDGASDGSLRSDIQSAVRALSTAR